MDTLEAARRRGVQERLTNEIRALIEAALPDYGFVLLTFDATVMKREVTVSTSLETPEALAKILRFTLSKVEPTS